VQSGTGRLLTTRGFHRAGLLQRWTESNSARLKRRQMFIVISCLNSACKRRFATAELRGNGGSG